MTEASENPRARAAFDAGSRSGPGARPDSGAAAPSGKTPDCGARADEPELDLAGARARLEGRVLRTPLLRAPVLDAWAGGPVHLKLECLQRTGSFKVRGAANRMAALTDEERRAGVVACSSGNHGRAVARVARDLGVAATLCVPEWVDPVKLAGMRADGAEVILAGATYDEADARAQELAARRGLVFVHPFDDPLVAAGQGTIALEILEDLPDVARVVIPLSGGGLAGGMAWALAHAGEGGGGGGPGRGPADGREAPEVVAVSATQASVMLRSLEAGRPVDLPEVPTLASALAGGIGLDNRLSFRLVRDYVDRHLEVDEDAIREAMRFAAERLRLVVEGGGAVGLAALLAGLLKPEAQAGRPQGPTAVVVSGGNVELEAVLGASG